MGKLIPDGKLGKLIPDFLGKVIPHTLPKERPLPIIVFPINGEYNFPDSATLLTINYIKDLCYYTGQQDVHSRQEKKLRTS